MYPLNSSRQNRRDVFCPTGPDLTMNIHASQDSFFVNSGMKNNNSYIFLFLFLLLCVCTNAQKDKNAIKKYHLKPVYLDYTGLPFDTTMDRLVMEAFTRHQIKLINSTELNRLIEEEAVRIAMKFRTGSSNFNSEREFLEAVSREQHFVANHVIIHFNYLATGNDSIKVASAKWIVTPEPTDVSVGKSSGEKETVLEDTCCSVRDNIFAIVDKILSLKWLQ
jgi:hypothetical protein